METKRILIKAVRESVEFIFNDCCDLQSRLRGLARINGMIDISYRTKVINFNDYLLLISFVHKVRENI